MEFTIPKFVSKILLPNLSLHCRFALLEIMFARMHALTHTRAHTHTHFKAQYCNDFFFHIVVVTGEDTLISMLSLAFLLTSTQHACVRLNCKGTAVFKHAR